VKSQRNSIGCRRDAAAFCAVVLHRVIDCASETEYYRQRASVGKTDTNLSSGVICKEQAMNSMKNGELSARASGRMAGRSYPLREWANDSCDGTKVSLASENGYAYLNLGPSCIDAHEHEPLA
jgi:hypothetical protein